VAEMPKKLKFLPQWKHAEISSSDRGSQLLDV
jgi:hypothetical protein